MESFGVVEFSYLVDLLAELAKCGPTECVEIKRRDNRVPGDFLCYPLWYCQPIWRPEGRANVPALSASFSCPLSLLKVASFPSPQIPCRPCRSMSAFELVLVIGTFGPRPRTMTARETSSASSASKLGLVLVLVRGMTAAVAEGMMTDDKVE